MRTRTAIHALVGAATLSALIALPAGAAPPSGPSGTIDLVEPAPAPAALDTSDATSSALNSAGPTLGNAVALHTSVEGKVSSKATIYVTVGCSQGDNLVYLASAYPDADGNVGFMMADQAGAGLDWESGGDADCEAWLIHRVDKGRSSEFTTLAVETFRVSDPSSHTA